MKNNTVKTIVLALAILLIYFIGRDYFTGEEVVVEPQILDDYEIDTTKKDVDKKGEAIIQKVDLSGNDNMVEYPSLNRATVFPAAWSQEVKDVLAEKMASLVSSLKEDPQNSDNWLALAIYRKQINDYDGAAIIWKFIASVDPAKSFVSYLNLGNLYHFELKNFVLAEEYLKKAISLDRGNVRAYQDLYDLYYLSYTEKKGEALPVLLTGLEHAPKSLNLLVSLAGHYKGEEDKENSKKYWLLALTVAGDLNDAAMVEAIEAELANLK